MTIDQLAELRGESAEDVFIDVALGDQLPLTMVLPSLVPSLGLSEESWRARRGDLAG